MTILRRCLRFATYRAALLSATAIWLAFSRPAVAQAPAGLVAAYSFQEGAGSTVADASGNGHTGTVVNASWTAAGKSGNALTFNGTSARVTINDSPLLRLTSAMTLEAWVNPSKVNNQWRDVIYKGNDNYFLEATSSHSSRPVAGGTFGSTIGEAIGTSALAANTWAHLAATYDGAMLRLYVNGVLVTSVARTGNLATSTNILEIGGDTIYRQYFQGTIDEVRLYNVALTTAQIQTDMNTPVGPAGPPVPDLTLTKTHGGTFAQGQTGATYTLTARNSGAAPTTGPVTVTDTLPTALTATGLTGAGWACTLATLTCTRSDVLGGGAIYPAITLTVNVATTAPASVTNLGAVSGGGESNTANNTASDVTTINGVPDLTVVKTHAGTFTQGQVGATYTLTATNSGTAATTGTVTVTDMLPGGLTATALSGSGWTCTLATRTCTRSNALGAGASYPAITLTVNVAGTAPASVTNTATITGGGESNTANNTATDVTTINGVPDLTVAKTHPGTFNPGQVGATYTLTVTNNGPGPTTGTVTVTDTLPADLTATALSGTGWTCTLAALTCTRSNALGAGASHPAITLTVNVATTAPATVTNTATVSGGGESNTTNNVANDPTAIAVSPDLTIAKTHTGAFVQGQVGATYTLTVTNGGTAPTTGTVTVADTLPTGLSATGLSGSGWTCTLTTLTCTRSDALSGGASYQAITLAVNVAGTAPASLTNTANVSGGGESNVANNTASDVTTINGVPDLTIVKTHAGTFTQGQVGATYTLTVTNSGTGATAGAVTVTDTLPAGLTASTLSGTGWTCTLATLTCTRSSALGAAASYPAITLTVNVGSTAPASVTNTAAVSGGGEVNTSNDTASDPTSIAVPVSGLVAAYGFEEGIGTVVSDVSGTGNSGNLGTGVSWTNSGKFGKALTFSGTGFVTVPNTASLRLTTAMTLEAWVNPTTVNAAWRDVIYKGDDNYYLEGTSGASGGVPATGGTFQGSNATIYGTAVPPLNTWSHLAAAYDGATLRLYVNGIQVASVPRTGALATSTNPLQIGGNSLYGQYFVGRIDEVRVYNVARSAAQIQADMGTPVGGTTLFPDVTISKSHTGSFTQGQVGATYTMTVTNGGTGPTSGSVTVNDALPGGLVATGLNGTGWSCTVVAVSCTRSDPLNVGASYPPITLTLNVSSSAPASVTNRATVSGGSDSTPANNTADDITSVSPSTDSQPPSAPGTLSAVSTSGTTIDLTWGPATDNLAVTGYSVERCQGVGCVDFIKLSTANPTGISLTDTGLFPNVSYSYFVRAFDGAGNFGPPSNVATVTTLSTIPELVAAYSFNEGSGSTVTDSSGKGNNGTIGSATWTAAGKFGKALFFNGTNARVTIPNSQSLRLSTGMTLEAWVNPSTVNTAWRDVIYKGNDIYYLNATSSPNGEPAAGGTFSPSPTFGGTPLAPGVWTHLAATHDGLTLRLYVNGTQVSALSVPATISNSTNPLEIGGDSIFGQYFHGSIDEVRVYSVARTPTQIHADMNTPLGGTVPVLEIVPTSVSFGPRANGTTGDPEEIQLTNIGSAALAITSISVLGPNSTDFSQTNTCGTSLGAGVSCIITARFSPSALGNRTATVSVQDDAAGSPHTIPLIGTSVAVLVTPSVAVLAPNQSQQFTATSGSVGSFIWSVDGVIGGSAAAGTITASGLYAAPANVGEHAVTASAPDLSQSGSAAIYVSATSGVFTYHNDNFRTGQNSNEIILKPSNVNPATFGKLGSYAIDGQAIATPLYVRGVTIPGVGVRDVVYVATEHDSVYAFDANLTTAGPLWHVSFINPAVGVTTIPSNDAGDCCDIRPEIGITGTPVIDQSTGTLYVVARTKESDGTSTRYVQRLHALDITNGAERFGGPVEIQATVPGNGFGSVNGVVTFNPLRQNQRAALLLDRGVVYIGWGSHIDIPPYHGWVMGYNASTLQQVSTFCTTPDARGGGVWLGSSGPAADAAGNIFFLTGDGPFDVHVGGRSYSDSYIRLSPAGQVLDYFTPSNQATLEVLNHDLAASNVILLPDQPGLHPRLALSAGKNGTIHVVDRDNMGGYNPNNDSQIVQSLVNIFPFGTPEPGNYSAPAYFNGRVYFSPVADSIQAFSLTNGLLSTSATSRSADLYDYPGGAISVSANGTSNGILWAITWKGASGRSVLRAYDATNLATQLYNSEQDLDDRLEPGAKFTTPVVANGKVFVASSGTLTVFGLRP